MDDKASVFPKSSGDAKIKEKFLLPKQCRELNINFVSSNDKRNIDDFDQGNVNVQKKKLKGQNKKRLSNKSKIPKSAKMCFAFGSTGTCAYGEKCSYSHDVTSFLLTKPEDIGETCYLYKTFGQCPYGFSCRFGSSHTLNGKNVVNEELVNKFKDKKLVLNSLSKDLQQRLRGHPTKYDFTKSYDLLKKIGAKVVSTGGGQNKERDGNDVFKAPDVNSTVKLEESRDTKMQEQEESIRVVPLKGNEINCSFINTSNTSGLHTSTTVEEANIRLRPSEMKKIDFGGKLYLAPLTTVGNLPFRRICKEFGADITCGEMAMATNILCGQQSEWALLKRHHTEDIFGVQLCGAHADLMTKCAQMITENLSVDFIDINMGCPLDLVYHKGAGSGLMNRAKKLSEIIQGMTSVMDVPLTMKMRAGVHAQDPIAHQIIKKISAWRDCIGLITVHGRSREQRYTKSADWDYINQCSQIADPIPLFGSGDVLSFEDYNLRMKESKVSGIMIARGALIKPWIFKEIKEERHWDISSAERFEMLKSYTNYGLEHWGSDTEGVEKTRRFLLEWLSFLYRYIPVGVLEQVPQRINDRPPLYCGRDDLETLMASPSCADWIKISEMLLGPVPEDFFFLPKHKANAYQ